MFQTLVPDPRKGGMTKALVYPKATNREIELGIIYPEEVMWASNTISVGGGDPEDARMFISVTDQTGSRHSVDPFHFRWNEGTLDTTCMLEKIASKQLTCVRYSFKRSGCSEMGGSNW